MVMTSISLFGLIQFARRSDPQFFDANFPAVVSPLVCVGITGGKGTLIDGEIVIRERM